MKEKVRHSYRENDFKKLFYTLVSFSFIGCLNAYIHNLLAFAPHSGEWWMLVITLPIIVLYLIGGFIFFSTPIPMLCFLLWTKIESVRNKSELGREEISTQSKKTFSYKFMAIILMLFNSILYPMISSYVIYRYF